MLVSSSQKHLLASESDQPILSLLTFSPVGSTLLGLTSLQREFFFNSMFRLLQLQSAENESRVRQMSGRILPPVSSAVMAVQRASGREKTREERQLERAKAKIARMESEQEEQSKERASYPAQAAPESQRSTESKQAVIHKQAASESQKGAQAEEYQRTESQKKLAKMKKISLPSKKQAKSAVSDVQSGMGEPMLDSALRQIWEQNIEKQKALFLRKIVFKGRADQVKSAQEGLAEILNEYARGNAAKAQEVLSEFASRMQQKDYESEELGAVLLLVIEDQICAGEEGEVGGARPGGSASKLIVPEKIQKTAAASAEIRLASVREMLRYYFMRHPEELRGALATALGAQESESESDAALQAKLSAALSEIGAFAVSQKVLAAIKEKKKLDTKKCLFELGYKYDKEKRKLILGKRTCGKPAEASGIVSLLLSKFKKPKK